MEQVTDWFTGEKPTRIGAYQREFPNGWGKCFTWWDGAHFCYPSETPLGAKWAAEHSQFRKSVHQAAPWRGITQRSAER